MDAEQNNMMRALRSISDFQDYENRALKTANRSSSIEFDIAIATLGLNGECGEVTEIIKKQLAHNKPVDHNRLKSELGDVLWYLTYLCNLLNIPLTDVASGNLDKLAARYPEGKYTQEAFDAINKQAPEL